MSNWLDELDESGSGGFSGMSLEEAQDTSYLWRILVWSDPGRGKSHFAYTMPQPIVFIDTEGKADAIAHKFDGDIFLWQPEDYEEAVDSLEEAINLLKTAKEKTGEIGTIVVDSMSVMWGWAQQHYVNEYYFGKDMSEVELTSGLGGGQSDWKVIKDFHNEKFRKKMLNTKFHLCWTAMREDDYETILEQGKQRADKPGGEKENRYKISDEIRFREDDDGATIGILKKSGLIRHKYSGLKWPTFEKHQKLTREIEEAELSEHDATTVDYSYDVTVTEGLPTINGDE